MRILSVFFFFLLGFSGWSQTITDKLSALNEVYPSEKIYLHTDRTFYSVTDEVYFKVYVVNGESHLPKINSNVISVNLLDAKGSILETKQLALNAGKASGCFQVRNLAGGIYKIKAFTNWTGNQGEEYIFEKEITVRKAVYASLLLKMETERNSYLPGERVNAWLKATDVDNQAIAGTEVKYEVLYQSSALFSGTTKTDPAGKAIISFDLPGTININDVVLTAFVMHEGKLESVFKPVTINLEKISMALLPEGGNLVNGLPGQVAFRAIRQNGKPVEVQGKLVDETGKTITEFRSVKFGMGKFDFTPKPGHTYTALVDPGNKQVQSFPLPTATRDGMVLHCEKDAKGKDKIRIWSTRSSQEISLLCYAHGKVYANRILKLEAGENIVALPMDSIPPGIAKFTLFDGMKPLCERLVFVNKDKTLKIKIETDQEKYSPFEKVKMQLTVKDHLDRPVEGNFSLAVVDEKNLTMANDKQDHILSSMLMSSELKGKIEEPNFYFKKDEPRADELLDLVMLTHGWRRYNWNEVLSLNIEDWKNRIKFPVDASGYTGTVMLDGYSGQKGEIDVTVLEPRKYTVRTDTNGIFFLPQDYISFPVKLRFRKNGYSEKTWVRDYELSRNNTRVLYNPFATTAKPMMSAEVSEQKELLKKEVTPVQDAVAAKNIKRSSLDAAPSLAGEYDVLSTTPGVMGGSDRELSEVIVTSPTMRNSLDVLNIRAVNSTSVAYINVGIDGFSSNYDYVYSGRTYYPHKRFGLMGTGYSSLNTYSKEFYAPDYTTRSYDYRKETDDRKTLYWQHDVVTNKEGKAEVSFFTCKNVSAYTATLEGMSNDGQVGMGTGSFYVQKPLELQVKLPVVITRGDHFIAKCILTNHTDKTLSAKVKVSENVDFSLAEGNYVFECTVPADSFVVKEIAVDVLSAPAAINERNRNTANRFSIRVEAEGLADDISQEITVNKAGFDYYATAGGNEKEKSFSFQINDPVETDFTAKLEVIVDPFKELDQSMRAMIREPHGCFEQVTSSNYPNILALQYLQKKGKADPEFTHKALEHLRSGYTQLAKYETAEHGFEWYGHTPPHEALTAMGLMQFHEMKKLGIEVDQKLIDRSIHWLMKRRTSSGVFQQNQGKYGFSGAPRATSSAYVTYALSAIGEKDLDKETSAIEKDLRDNFDFYKMALLTNTYFNLGKTDRANVLVEKLVAHVKKQGIDKIQTGPSFTYCYSPVVECMALLTIAITENKLMQYKDQVVEYSGYLYSKRSYMGHYGNTQQTVMALRALMATNDYLDNASPRAGEMMVYINDRALPAYQVSPVADIRDASLGKYLVKGKNTVRLVYTASTDKAPLYNFGATWKELLPEDAEKNKVNIETSYPKTEFNEGETARMNIVLTNTTREGLPQTVAVIGTPAGMSFDSQELKRLMEEKLFDYYELKDNYLVLYYAEMAPEAVVQIPLNLKSEIPGNYVTPPACAYLYYNSESKSWSKTGRITIR